MTAEGHVEIEELLRAALSDWVDFLFVPTPEPFVIYAVLRRSIRSGVCVHVLHHARTIPLNRRGIPNLLLQIRR